MTSSFLFLEGSTAKFDCIVGGTPLPSVTWLKNGAAIKGNKQIQVTSEGDTSTLILFSVTKTQAGQYTALAANLNGSILAATELVVLEGVDLRGEGDDPWENISKRGGVDLRVGVMGDDNPWEYLSKRGWDRTAAVCCFCSAARTCRIRLEFV